MADQRAFIEIRANLTQALEQFKKFEKTWIEVTRKMDIEADKIDFDVTNKDFLKLIKTAEKARAGMVRTAQQAGVSFERLNKTVKLTDSSFEDLNKDIKRVGASAKQAQSSMVKAATKGKAAIDKQRAGVDKLRSSVSKLRGTFATLGVTIALAKGLRNLASFEKSMSQVKAVTEATTEQFAALNDTAIELGRVTIFTTTQVAEGMALLGRAGFEVNEIMTAMPGLLSLAAAGNLDLATAVNIASNTLRAFNLDAIQMNRVADTLATAAASANTSIAQMGEAMKFASPAAAAAGFSIEEVAAALGVLSNKGLQASLAGTSLRQIMLQLAAPSNKAKKQIAELGLTMSDVNPEIRSMTDIIQTLADANVGLGESATIGNKRAGTALLSLISGIDMLKNLNEELLRATFRAKDMADTMIDNVAGSFKRFTSALDAMVQRTGREGLSGALQGLLEIGRQALIITDRGIAAMVALIKTGFAPITLAIGVLAQATSVLLNTVGNAISVIPIIGKKFEVMTEAIHDSADALNVFAVNQGTAFTEAITGGKIADFFNSVTDNFSQITDVVKDFQPRIDTAVERLRAFVATFKDVRKATDEERESVERQVNAILTLLESMPDKQRRANEDLFVEIRQIGDQYRVIKGDIVAVGEEAQRQQLAFEEMQDAFSETVAGPAESLELLAEAQFSIAERLENSGLVTIEVAQNIAKEVEKLIKEFARFGKEVPEDLEDLAERFPVVDDAIAETEKRVESLVKSFGASEEALNKEVEALDATVIALRDRGDISDQISERISASVTKLIEKFEALGVDAPLALRNLADEFGLIDKAVTKFIDGVAGNREKLTEETNALIQGVAALKSQGGITKEVAENIAEAVVKLIEKFQDLGIEAPKSLQTLAREFGLVEDAVSSFIESVASDRESLVEETNALIEGVAILSAEGEITVDVAKKISEAIGELLLRFAELGIEAPAALTALIEQFPLSTEVMDALAESTDNAAKSMRQLAEETEMAQAALEKLNDAQKASDEAASATQTLADEVQNLQDKAVLTLEETERLSEAQVELTKANRDGLEATQEVNVAQADYEQVLRDAERGTVALEDSTVDLVQELNVFSSTMGDLNKRLSDAATANVAGRFRDAATGAKELAKATNEIEKSTGIEKMEKDAAKAQKAIDNLKASFEGIGDASGDFQQLNTAVGTLQANLNAANAVCEKLVACLRQVGV